jgi:hypothetical protein
VGKTVGKIAIARHEYRHLTSAITSFIRLNTILVLKSAVQKIFRLFWYRNSITIFTEPDCKPHKTSSQFLDSFYY